jgi:hypothetical protein
MSNVLETLSEQELIQRKHNLLYQLERIENQLQKIKSQKAEVIFEDVEITTKSIVSKKIVVKINQSPNLKIHDESNSLEEEKIESKSISSCNTDKPLLKKIIVSIKKK